MKMTTSVYMLKPNLTDPRFEGFIIGDNVESVLGNECPLQDLKVDNGGSLDWQPKRLRAAWRPMAVNGPVQPFNDYPCIELNKPAFSHRAVNALGEFLADNGEVLPLAADIGEYYAFNALTKLEALNVSKSRMTRTRNDSTAIAIDYFVFKPSKLKGASIFRIREKENQYFVTDQFKDRVEQACLNGMTFTKVWPLPEDGDWLKDRAELRRKQKKVTLVGEGLTVCLKLKKPKPSPAEKQMATLIGDELQSQRLSVSTAEPYLGSVERSEVVDGEWHIRCTCPSCDALAEHITDWLSNLDWKGEIAILKRYGNLFHGRAKQRRVTIENN